MAEKVLGEHRLLCRVGSKDRLEPKTPEWCELGSGADALMLSRAELSQERMCGYPASVSFRACRTKPRD